MKMGFTEVLTVLLIVLKLLGKINISWLMVFMPMIVVYAAIGLFIAAAIVLKVYFGGKNVTITRR
jgi:hypothetical protein